MRSPCARLHHCIVYVRGNGGRSRLDDQQRQQGPTTRASVCRRTVTHPVLPAGVACRCRKKVPVACMLSKQNRKYLAAGMLPHTHMAKTSLARAFSLFSHQAPQGVFAEANTKKWQANGRRTLETPQPSLHYFTHISSITPQPPHHLTPEPQALAPNANASVSLVSHHVIVNNRKACPFGGRGKMTVRA
jgi:hypothetical protein